MQLLTCFEPLRHSAKMKLHCMPLCVCVCVCVCLSAGGERRKKSPTSLLERAPAGPQLSFSGSLTNIGQEPLVLSGYWPKKPPQGSQPDNTHTHTHTHTRLRLSQGHTRKHGLRFTPPQDVLSDGKSGLPFPEVH